MGREAYPGVAMRKFAEPLESQRLSFLLEKAASREAQMWKAYVPKKTYTGVQVNPTTQKHCAVVHMKEKAKLCFEVVSFLGYFLGTDMCIT